MEMKIEMFTIFDKFAKPGAIFASTSRSISIEDLAAVTFCPERCIGMRFVSNAEGADAIEFACAPDTSQETIAMSHEVAQRMGREISVVRGNGARSIAETRRGGRVRA
jgi:3-hydroxyacyl-CoA dehydrogenase